jgi:very-short-patch-repair endonuclease
VTRVRDVAPRPVRESRPELARGLETQLAGFGITGCSFEFRLHPGRKWAYDVAILEHRVLIEIDGGAWLHTKGKTNHGHGQGRGFVRDRDKDALAHGLGFRPMRVTVDRVKDGTAAILIRQAIRQESPLPDDVRKILKLEVIGV